MSFAVREYVVHNQEWESEILTHQNNLQFLYIPLMPDHTKYVEKMEMDSASPGFYFHCILLERCSFIF